MCGNVSDRVPGYLYCGAQCALMLVCRSRAVGRAEMLTGAERMEVAFRVPRFLGSCMQAACQVVVVVVLRCTWVVRDYSRIY